MQKKLYSLLLLAVFLFTITSTVFAETNPPSQPDDLSQQVIDVTPTTAEEVQQGAAKMEKDVSNFGEKFSTPVAIFGIVASILCIFLGAIFSKKLLAIGFGSVLATVFTVLIFNDMSFSIQMIKDLANTLRSWL